MVVVVGQAEACFPPLVRGGPDDPLIEEADAAMAVDRQGGVDGVRGGEQVG